MSVYSPSQTNKVPESFQSVMDKENSCPSFLGSPDLNSTVDVSTAGPGGTTKHVPIRPLTAAYRAASSDQEVGELLIPMT